MTDAAGLRRTGWASSVCAGDYDNDGWIDLFVTYYGRNVLYRNRGGPLRGRHGAGGARDDRGSAGDRAARSSTTTATARLDLFVANYLRFDLATAAGARRRRRTASGRACRSTADPRDCPPTRTCSIATAATARSPTSPTPPASSKVTGRYSMTAVDDRPRRRRLARHLRRVATRRRRSSTATTTTARSPTSPSRAAPPTARTATRRPAWAWPSATTTATAGSTSSRRISPTTCRRSIATSGRGCSRTWRARPGSRVENRYVEWGAGMPDLDNDGRPDLFYVTGNVYPEIEAAAAAVPAPQPARRLPERRRGAFEPVTAQSGDAAVAALEPRRRLRRHRQRRRHRRARDEHERAAVAAAQRLRRRAAAGSRSRSRARAPIDRAIGATVVVTAGGRTQARTVLSQSSYYSHDDLRLHFGLGDSRTVDRIEVRWPAGGSETLTNVQAGRVADDQRTGAIRSRLDRAGELQSSLAQLD